MPFCTAPIGDLTQKLKRKTKSQNNRKYNYFESYYEEHIRGLHVSLTISPLFCCFTYVCYLQQQGVSLKEYCRFQTIVFSHHSVPVFFDFQLETVPNVKHALYNTNVKYTNVKHIFLFAGAEFAPELDWM